MSRDGANCGFMSNGKIATELGGNLPYDDDFYQVGVYCHRSSNALFNRLCSMLYCQLFVIMR